MVPSHKALHFKKTLKKLVKRSHILEENKEEKEVQHFKSNCYSLAYIML